MPKKKKNKLVVNGHTYALRTGRKNMQHRPGSHSKDACIQPPDSIENPIQSTDGSVSTNHIETINGQSIINDTTMDQTIAVDENNEAMEQPPVDQSKDQPDCESVTDDPDDTSAKTSTEVMDSTHIANGPTMMDHPSSHDPTMDQPKVTVTKTKSLNQRNSRFHENRKEDKVSFLYKPAGKAKTTVAAILLILLVICFAAVIAVGIIGYNMIKDAPTL